MNTLKLTRSDFDANGKYVGAVDINGYDGNVEIEERLGWCVFVAIKVTGYLRAKAGSGIEAGWGIKAGSGIEAGSGIDFKFQLFAGVVTWRKRTAEDGVIRCTSINGGDIVLGEVIITADAA